MLDSTIEQEIQAEADALQGEYLQALMDPDYDQAALTARVDAFNQKVIDIQTARMRAAKQEAEAEAKDNGTWAGVPVTIQGFAGEEVYDLGVVKAEADRLRHSQDVDGMVGGLANTLYHIADFALSLAQA